MDRDHVSLHGNSGPPWRLRVTPPRSRIPRRAAGCDACVGLRLRAWASAQPSSGDRGLYVRVVCPRPCLRRAQHRPMSRPRLTSAPYHASAPPRRSASPLTPSPSRALWAGGGAAYTASRSATTAGDAGRCRAMRGQVRMRRAARCVCGRLSVSAVVLPWFYRGSTVVLPCTRGDPPRKRFHAARSKPPLSSGSGPSADGTCSSARCVQCAYGRCHTHFEDGMTRHAAWRQCKLAHGDMLD